MSGEAPINLTADPDALNPIRRIVSTEGWSAEPVTLMSGSEAIRLTAGSAGRGKRRESYLIVADTLALAFRSLAYCLEAFAAEEGQ